MRTTKRDVVALLGAAGLGLSWSLVAGVGPAAAAVCASAGTTGMTARVVVTTATVVSGEVDATGCDLGIYVGPGAEGAVVDGATVSGANDHGILVQDVSDVAIRNSLISGNGVSRHNVPGTSTPLSEDKALTLLGTRHVVVEDNTVRDNVGDGGISVNDDGNSPSMSVLSPGLSLPAVDNVIRGNVVSGNLGGCGIVLSAWNPGQGVNHNTVTGNVVTGAPGVFPPVIGSIVVAADPPNTSAVDNVVMKNVVTDSFIPGIIVHSNAPGDYVSGTQIVNNTLARDDWGKVDGPNATTAVAVEGRAAGAPSPSVLTDTVVAGNRISQQDIGIWVRGATNSDIGGYGVNHATEPVVFG